MDGNHLSIGDRVSIGEVKEFWIVSAKTHERCILTQTKVVEDPTGWWAMDGGAVKDLINIATGPEWRAAIDPKGISWSVIRGNDIKAWVAMRFAIFSHKTMERWHRV